MKFNVLQAFKRLFLSAGRLALPRFFEVLVGDFFCKTHAALIGSLAGMSMTSWWTEAWASPLHLGLCLGVQWGAGVTRLSRPQQAAWLALSAALIQITRQPLCFAMIKRYSAHGKMCCSKLCVAPVANLIYTMGNRKAFFIWLNSRLWHEISFLISTCWKCYDNKNTFFFHCWESKKITLPRFMYYCRSVLWHSLGLIIRCDSVVVLSDLLLTASIHATLRMLSWWPQLLFLLARYIDVKLIDNEMIRVSAVIIKLQRLNHQFRKLLCLF